MNQTRIFALLDGVLLVSFVVLLMRRNWAFSFSTVEWIALLCLAMSFAVLRKSWRVAAGFSIACGILILISSLL